MKQFILILTLLLTASMASAYYIDDITVKSQLNAFNTGQYVSKIRTSDYIVVDDPQLVQQAVFNFNHDLSLEFWNDPGFHPAIFQEPSKFQSCGMYPARLCVPLNEYGGFVVNDRDLPDEFVGYGAYDRMKVNRGRLYPRGPMRMDILSQNMELLSYQPTPAQVIKTVSAQPMPTWLKQNSYSIMYPGYSGLYQQRLW